MAAEVIAHCRGDDQKGTSNGFERISHKAISEVSMTAIGRPCLSADRWRILIGADAHKIDEMVRQSPERAYDIAFFDEFARRAGWTERLSLENPELRPPS